MTDQKPGVPPTPKADINEQIELILSGEERFSDTLELLKITETQLKKLQTIKDLSKISPENLHNFIVMISNTAISSFNVDRKAQGKALLQPIDEVSSAQLSMMMLIKDNIRSIALSDLTSDPQYDELGIYQFSGTNKGLYLTQAKAIKTRIYDYNPAASKKYIEEVISSLEARAPRVARTHNPDFVAVNNGIFNYRTKKLQDFNPNIILLAKSPISFPDTPPMSPIIEQPDGTTWDVETWIEELSDDEGIPELLWQVIGASLRPMVSWDKAAFFFSRKGNNGKGTLCSMIRNLLGDSAAVSLAIEDMSKDFQLESLIRATAIVTDENNVSAHIDKAANFKVIVTHDKLLINRKYRSAVAIRPYVFMIQCFNDYPPVKDKTESFYRRQLFIPFNKHFEGIANKAIKDDYLTRHDVLEYVLYRTLVQMEDYYTFNQVEATIQALDEYREHNDPITEFYRFFREEFTWDFLPFTFLYDLYVSWSKRYRPSSMTLGLKRFIESTTEYIDRDPAFFIHEKGHNSQVRPGTMMDTPEPLISEYSLDDWKSPSATNDPNELNKPILRTRYRGIFMDHSKVVDPEERFPGITTNPDLKDA